MMRELRTVLVMVSPLLAGLVRYVVAARIEQSDARLVIIAETSDLQNLPDRLGAIDPDLVIIGPARVTSQRIAASAAAHTRVLTMSTNLGQVLGPGPTDVVAFTPDALTQRLRDMLQEI
jgi:hypothetical protein